MLNQINTCTGKIKDIQNHEDLILVTDPLEVEYILKHIGYLVPYEDQIEFSGLLVLIGDGDYEEVYGFEECVPYLDKNLWSINVHNCLH